ncbi:MAG: JAB domain-containing protein [Segetibacter sp.]
MAALKSNACCLILSYNHPSGNLKPSHADEALTRKISEAGKLLDIQVIDHVIVTSEGYYSFADEGLLKPFIFRQTLRVVELPLISYIYN